MKVLVLDTSALIMGLDPLGLEFEIYSVPEVTEELRYQAGPSYRVAISTSSGKLKIQSPTPRVSDTRSGKSQGSRGQSRAVRDGHKCLGSCA